MWKYYVMENTKQIFSIHRITDEWYDTYQMFKYQVILKIITCLR